MDLKILMVVAGIAAMSIASIGVAASITATGVNKLAAEDSITIAAPSANVTDIKWTEEVKSDGTIEIASVILNVGNTDTSNTHSYQVCALVEQGSTFSVAADGTPDCTNLTDAAANSKTDVTITLSAQLAPSGIDAVNFSIEETA